MKHKGAIELSRALTGAHGETDCEASLDELEAYVAAQLAGEPYAARFPAVARHLDACVACSEAYALLYEALAAGAAAPDPSHIPAPDLGFLPAPPVDPRAALAGAVQRIGAGLRLTFSRRILDLFASGPAGATAVRATGKAPLFDITIDRAGEPISELRVSAYPAAGAADSVVVRVQLELEGRDWPALAGAAVVLAAGAARREALTDAWGEAVFEAVPLAFLADAQVEARPPEGG